MSDNQDHLRDVAGPGVTVITKTRDESSGYKGFTDAELIPHTDGSAESDPHGLLLLACRQAADKGGSTRVVEGGPGRKRIRLRLDDLAWFSTEPAGAIRLLPVTGILPGFPSRPSFRGHLSGGSQP